MRDDNRRKDPGEQDVVQPPTLEHLDQLPRENGEGKGPPEEDTFLIQPPAVELPKGGGAVQGIGETYRANPVTGTGSMSVPIAISPGRGGVQPQLALSYDSGSGNGPFGHGWNVGISSIRRKTDKGLPRYRDTAVISGEEGDVFVLAGSEDLVPKLDDAGLVQTRPDGEHDVQEFHPRVEGGFSRIERWRKRSDGDVHWRTRDAGNVVRIYGQSAAARVADPDDASRVFEWLLESVSDEVGNLIQYEYVADNRDGIDPAPAELSRTKAGHRSTYVYPKAVRYGNRTPGNTSTWFFHLVFDYGDHTEAVPTVAPTVGATWPARLDPYSSFRAGFDMRCYRLCRRILMFHQFPELNDDVPVLVRTTELTYDEQPHLTKLIKVSHKGRRTHFDATPDEEIETPGVAFTYLQSEIGQAIESVQGLDDVGTSFDVGQWQWIDLDGEGLSGLLTEQGGAWFYKRNEGEGKLGVVQTLGQRPSFGLSEIQLMDLGGDGRLDAVSFTAPLAGHQERGEDGHWGPFHAFETVPNVDLSNPDVRVIDLNGDGHGDILVTEDDVFRWYPSKAKQGFDGPQYTRKVHQEADGPTLVFSSDGEAIFLADMTGDGLTDLVRVRHNTICYWPNRGHGRFGAKVVMAAAPHFDHPDRFDSRRIRLVDADGTGPADVLYVGPHAVRLWFNHSGNGWGSEQVTRLTGVHDVAQVQVADVLGDGTACIVWSSSLPGDRAAPLKYLRLMAQGKPHLLSQVDNGMGRITTMTYAPSTKFYLADRQAGTPWATRLHFPVHVLEKVEMFDRFSGWRFANTYTYHHGFYDGVEREFRGFGMVEQRDTETIADFEGADSQVKHHVDPVVTRTWFHTGAWLTHQDLQATYAAEGFQGDAAAPVLAPSSLPDGLAPAEAREATRALRGSMLRQEVYAEDGDVDKEDNPYVVTTTRFEVKQIQPKLDQRHGVFQVVPAETRTANYERTSDDPRVGHELVLETDAYGQPVLTAQVAYPRRPSGQQQDTFRVTTYEITGTTFSGTDYSLVLAEALNANYFVMIEGTQDTLFNRADNVGARVVGDPFGTSGLETTSGDRTLKLSRGSSSDGAWTGTITVVECVGDAATSGFTLKGVVDLTLPSSATSNATVATEAAAGFTFNANQCTAFGGRRGGGATVTSGEFFSSLFGAIELVNSDTVRYTRHGGGKALDAGAASIYVVEWGSEHTIQHVTVSGSAHNGHSPTATATAYDTVALSTAVDRAHTWVWFSGHTDNWRAAHNFAQTLADIGDGVTELDTESTVYGSGKSSQSRTLVLTVHTHPSIQVDRHYKAMAGAADNVSTYAAPVAAGQAGETYDEVSEPKVTSGRRFAIHANAVSVGGGKRMERLLASTRYTASGTVTLTRSEPVGEWSTRVQSVDLAGVTASASTHLPEMDKLDVIVSERMLLDDDASTSQLHLHTVLEEKSWELTKHDFAETDTQPFTVASLKAAWDAATEIAFEATPATTPGGGGVYPTEKRRLTETRIVYFAENGIDPFTKFTMDANKEFEADQHDISAYPFPSRRIVYESYQLAFPDTWLTATFDTRVTSTELLEGGYVQLDGAHWWRPSGRPVLRTGHFYLPDQIVDPFGQATTVGWHSSDLFPLSLTNVLGHVASGVVDLQTLTHVQTTDVHGHHQHVALDALGRVAATWVASSDGSFGDNETHPTTELTYTWPTDTVPASIRMLAREVHGPTNVRWQESVQYSDGGGAVVLAKAKAKPGDAYQVENDVLVLVAGANPRWIGSGRTLLDNKGNPVKQYEPYFSTTDAYEDEDEIRQLGVTPILQYDPVGRQTRVDYPDGTFETVMFDGWSQTTFDRCDNVVGSDWEAERTSSLDEDVQRALQASQTHANTPSRGFLDSQGRPVRTEETPDGTTWHATVMKYDVQGNTLSVTDARGIVTQADTSDAMGRPSYSTSPDAGESWVLLDVGGQPIRVWKTGDLTVRHTYDVLRRPVGVYVQDGVSAPERLAEAMFYGDFLYDAGGSDRTLAENGNLRARPWRTYDGAGVVEVEGYDFKGNPLSSSRTFLSTVDAEPDWVAVLKGSGGNPPPSDLAGLNSEAAPNLLTEVWTTSTTFDALNRVATQTTPDNSVTRPTYDDGGALTSVDVDVRGTTPATAFVRELDHNARGQRTLIAYSKNAAGDGGAFTTTYEYDDKTYRLIRLRTVLDGGSVVLQDWRYVYDAAGNIVKVHDDVADTVYFNNGVADATLLYKYDALYRLVSAQGREHASQQAPDPGDPSIPTMGGIPDTNACATYVQEYSYDAVGNITRMHHQQGDESSPGSTVWDIAYTYASDSNRLVSTTHPTTSAVQSYVHSARGAMTSMPHLPWGMTRDWRDQLRHVVLDAGAHADEAHYHYDAEGQRVRKVIEHSSGTKERLYLGGFEVYRELDTLGVVTLERETLHVMDGERRIAMVDTETTAPVVSSIFRFQLGNHLDSVSAEVDKDGNLLTYEEFHPYGTTAWKATVSGISLKRYRYTGMERDDETGLALHGVRYYAPWLGRWGSADPIGLGGGMNRYQYGASSPVGRVDRTGAEPIRVPIVEGETTLWGLAETHLGSGTRWREIQRHNPGIADKPKALPSGKSLIIYKDEPPAAAGEPQPPWARGVRDPSAADSAADPDGNIRSWVATRAAELERDTGSAWFLDVLLDEAYIYRTSGGSQVRSGLALFAYINPESGTPTLAHESFHGFHETSDSDALRRALDTTADAFLNQTLGDIGGQAGTKIDTKREAMRAAKEALAQHVAVRLNAVESAIDSVRYAVRHPDPASDAEVFAIIEENYRTSLEDSGTYDFRDKMSWALFGRTPDLPDEAVRIMDEELLMIPPTIYDIPAVRNLLGLD